MRRRSDQGNGEAQQEKGSERGEHASGGNDDLRGAEFDRTHEEDGYRGGPPSEGKDPSYYPSADEIWDDDEDDCGISNTDFVPSSYIFPEEIIKGPSVFFEGDKAKDLDPHGDIEQIDETDGESYAERSNDSSRAEGRKVFRTASQIRRTKQKRASKRRTMERAKLALQAEKAGSMTWKPRRCIEITLKAGMALQFRWQCDQMIRAYTAYIAVHKGVNILQTWEKVRMNCWNSDCPTSMVFNWQPRNGLWKMNEFIPHCEECRGHDSSSSGSGSHPKSFCALAYTPLQVARAVLSEAASDPNISAKTIGALVRAKQIYRRQPPDSHCRSVRFEIIRHMNASRDVDMAALEGYADLLRRCGHTVRIFIINGVQMEEQRIKAAWHTFAQCKKAKNVPADATFDVNVVDTSDISDNGRYYGGLLFVPNMAASYCMYGRKTAAADAAHCDGVGPQSYGTTFEVITYDTNMHLLPLLFAHFIGPEKHTTWKTVFEECKLIPAFDLPGRTTIVDREKSIDKAYKEDFENAKLFLDPLHVRKNMGMKLGETKAILLLSFHLVSPVRRVIGLLGLSLYERALCAPSRASVDDIVRQYTSVEKEYLAEFDRSELYKSYSNLQDLIVTSQGAESQMGASLRNHISSMEPHKMLHKVVDCSANRISKAQICVRSVEKPSTAQY